VDLQSSPPLKELGNECQILFLYPFCRVVTLISPRGGGSCVDVSRVLFLEYLENGSLVVHNVMDKDALRQVLYLRRMLGLVTRYVYIVSLAANFISYK
jgi:hypothetical protein